MSKRKELLAELEFLKKYEAKLIAEKGLKDLYFFNREIIERGNPARQKNIVPHVHGEWWKWYKSSKSRLKLLLVPRYTLKTTFFTVGGTLQRIANNPDVRILLANATLGNSSKFLGEIKSHIQHNESYRENYGDFYNPDGKWTETEIEVLGRSPGVREPTVTAVGVGGNLVSQHYDQIIADDLVNETNVTTREQALKVIEWWRRAMSLLDPEGEMLTIGTRWAHYELYQYIIDELSEQVDMYIRSAYREDGSAYYPEMLSLKKLDELREIEKSYIFSAFYLNDPVDEETSLVKRSQIHYYDQECRCGKIHKKPKDKELAIFITCDPAVSQSTRADFSAIDVVGLDVDANWWVLEANHGHWTVDETITRLFDANRRYQPIGVSIEVIGLAQTLLQIIHDREILANEFLPLTEIKSRAGQKKESRIRSALQPRFERGKIFIDSNMTALEEELIRYPRSKHDDLIDALTDVAEIGATPDVVPEPKKEPVTIQERIWANLNREEEIVDPVLGDFF